MKTFVLFGVLAVILVAGVHCEWEKSEEECVHELNLDKEEMQKLEAQVIVPEHHSDFLKFLECDWKKEGSMKADGELHWDKIDDLLFEDLKKEFGDNPYLTEILTLAAVAECKEEDIKGSSPGQVAAKVQNCVVHKLKKLIDESNESK